MKRLHWQQIAATEITQIYCNSPFDGVVLDNEHGIFNEQQLFALIQLINAHGKESYVRFATLDKPLVRKVMDAGVTGLIFSTIETIGQVKEFDFWCKYPPAGGSRGQGLVAENGWGLKPHRLQRRNPVIIAQIETLRGMQILPVLIESMDDKIDGYLIGPYDLSASLGCCGNWRDPEFKNQIDKFDKLIPNQKKAIHLPTGVGDQLERYSHYGMVAMGMDTLALTEQVNRLDVISRTRRKYIMTEPSLD